jgi:hypothetical protein
VTRTAENSAKGANCEPYHTHFLLVDTGKQAQQAWGSEIDFRNVLERRYSLRRKVPRVLIVVQGGPGTLHSIVKALESECPVVLVADSGGVATLLHQYLENNGELPAHIESDPCFQVGLSTPSAVCHSLPYGHRARLVTPHPRPSFGRLLRVITTTVETHTHPCFQAFLRPQQRAVLESINASHKQVCNHRVTTV